MSLRAQLRERVRVHRRGLTVATDTSEYGQEPIVETPLAVIPGTVQEQAGREVPTGDQGGTVVVDAIGFFLPGEDIVTGDRLEVENTGRSYEVVFVRDAAARRHHLEVALRQATRPVVP